MQQLVKLSTSNGPQRKLHVAVCWAVGRNCISNLLKKGAERGIYGNFPGISKFQWKECLGKFSGCKLVSFFRQFIGSGPDRFQTFVRPLVPTSALEDCNVFGDLVEKPWTIWEKWLNRKLDSKTSSVFQRVCLMGDSPRPLQTGTVGPTNLGCPQPVVSGWAAKAQPRLSTFCKRLESVGMWWFWYIFIIFHIFFTYFSWSAVDGFTHPRPTQKGCFCDGSSWRRQAAKPWACRSAGTEIKNSLQEKGNVSIRPCLIIHAVILLQVDWNQSGEGWVGGREHKWKMPNICTRQVQGAPLTEEEKTSIQISY